MPPVDKALNLVLDDDRPLKIINAPENISAAIMRLQNFDGRFLYVVKYLDKDIYIAFLEDHLVKIYKHDEAIPLLNENILNSISWKERGGYSWGKTPKVFADIIHVLN